MRTSVVALVAGIVLSLCAYSGCSRSSEQDSRGGQAQAQTPPSENIGTNARVATTHKDEDCIRGEVALNDFVQKTHKLSEESNELVAEREAAKYAGTCCEVRGSVLVVWREETAPGQIAVTLRSPFEVPLITGSPSTVVWSCLFPESYEPELTKLAEGDSVRARGRFSVWEKPAGTLYTFYGLTDCELLPHTGRLQPRKFD